MHKNGAPSRDRRRGSLLSVPRGSRSIVSLQKDRLLLVGTCVAAGANELSLFSYVDDSCSLQSKNAYDCPGELWGICELTSPDEDAAENDKLIAVASRHKGFSAVGIWRLPAARTSFPPTPSGDEPSVVRYHADVVANEGLAGKSMGVALLDDTRLLVCSSRDVCVVSIESSRKTLFVEHSIPCSSDDKVVAATNLGIQAAFIISTRNNVFIHDVRTPGEQGIPIFSSDILSIERGDLSNGEVQSKASTLRVLPDRRLISSVSTGNDYFVTVGDECGYVCGLDVRVMGGSDGRQSSLIWTATDVSAHTNWVTSLSVGPGNAVISGGADGVVRAWSGSGQPAGIYPLHDDTVYGTTWVGDGWGFASVSYDGRLAVNAKPVGLD